MGVVIGTAAPVDAYSIADVSGFDELAGNRKLCYRAVNLANFQTVMMRQSRSSIASFDKVTFVALGSRTGKIIGCAGWFLPTDRAEEIYDKTDHVSL